MVSLGRPRVLITGISGFTGLHLAKAFQRLGWDVVGLGHKQLDIESAHCNFDLLETEKLAEWLALVKPNYIVHLAALSHVVGDALAFYQVNVLGTESLLNAILNSGIQPEKILIASSANVYGNAKESPISEKTAVRPVNHYALSKAAMELLVMKWFDRFPMIVTRPFNYTGPGQKDTFLVPKIVKAFAQKQPILTLGNLDVARDISSIHFVCEAYLKLLTSTVSSEIINICSGRSISLLSIVDAMEEIAGYRPKIEVDPAFVRADEIKELCGDTMKLFGLVGNIENKSLHDVLLEMYRVFQRQS